MRIFRRVTIGFGIGDFRATIVVDPNPDHGAKRDARVQFRLGGVAVTGAAAMRLASGIEPEVRAIVGRDFLGKLVGEEIKRKFPSARTIETAEHTRASLIVPRDDRPCEFLIYSSRPAVDHVQTINALDGLLLDETVNGLLIGSLSAADLPIVEHCLQRGKQTRKLTYFCPTISQLRDGDNTLRLLQMADVVQLNVPEMEVLSARCGIANGIQWWKDRGLGTLILTAGTDGIYAVVGGEVVPQRAFKGEVVCDVGLGEFVSGTLIEWLAAGQTNLRDGLRLAAAAAAMAGAGIARRGGWGELRSFADRTPLRRPESPRPARKVAQPNLGRWAERMAYVAAGVAVTAITQIAMGN